MKKYYYSIMQAITHNLNEDTDYTEVERCTNIKIANKTFNAFKEIGDTQQHHHFYQETQLLKVYPAWDPDDAKVETLRTETWEFTGMKGKKIK